ncbi:Cof-type HAD-IIB family hydrolase [Streptococcus sciuri]|uniref:peptidylprolyl isomerase n=1 Tax=Streptococcus sciuri TaxID=2973939 RepID=A0ABT2F7Z7_9STRE|nr:Cof-type HAD-IIB family hydrolase [Streptococcus sciuri]MCS4488588.1 Cof-type HAD-IIB family hydrolase [Streptococcus sciuri]
MDAKVKYKAKKIKAVFFDIDDTLRRKATGFIPDTIQTVFEELKKKGIVVGIATGRAYYGVVPEIRSLEPDYFVTINGAYILDKKAEPIQKHPISKDIIKDYISWARESKIAYGFCGADKPIVSERSKLIDDAMVPVYGICDVDSDYYKNNDVYQMWTFEEVGDSLQLSTELQEHLRLVRWHENSSDVVQSHISKATGVKEVADKLGLRSENILVFGDGPNDMEIFDYAGLCVAMGDGVSELKEKADYVTTTLEEHGIYQALVALGLVDKKRSFPQVDIETFDGPVATIKTNLGDMIVKLFADHTPKTVANFLGLAKQGYYDGITFHRVIKEFMIQGGDPTGTGMGGESIYGESFEDEFSEELYNIRGALSMANAGPNTNGSQFFIVQNSKIPYAKKELVRGGWPEEIAEIYATNGGTPHLDYHHTVFGQLIGETSYQTLDKIASVETKEQDRPVEDVVIETIEVKE